MKNKLFTIICLSLSLLFFAACNSSEVQIAEAIAKTETARPTSTFTPGHPATNTPEPTETLTPTVEPNPTPALPDVVWQTYHDIEVIYRQDFGSDLSSYSPLGWKADGSKLYTTADSLEINGGNVVAFYEDETISLNEAVVLRFKFAPQSSFTIGIDGARQGKRIPAYQPGFRSISMDFRIQNTPLVFFNSEQNHYYTRFDGNLKLLPDIWYMYTLGFTNGKLFVIKVWDPENPENILSYKKQVDDMPNVNLFIMWVNQDDKLFIDDFTIIKFSRLNE